MIAKLKQALAGRMALAPAYVGNLTALVPDADVVQSEYLAQHGREDDIGHRPYEVLGSTAVIDVSGVLVHRLGLIGSFFGMQGYDGIEAQLEMAARDDLVSDIVLNIHSPGGQVFGAGQCGLAIQKMDKPVTALVNEMAASAGYWLACGADRIVAIDGADVGSIGVIMVHLNAAGAYEAMGLEFTTFKSGEMKDTFTDKRAMTSQEITEVQADIDAAADRFFGWVSSRRNISTDQIKAMQARVYAAGDAMAQGLVDEITNKDEFFNALHIRGGQGQSEGEFPMANEEGRDKAAFTEADLVKAKEAAVHEAKAQHEADLAAAVAKAIAEKDAEFEAEKARVSAIKGLDESKGREALADVLVEQGASVDFAKAALAAAPKSYSAQMDELGGAGIEPTVESAPKAIAGNGPMNLGM